MKYKNETIEYKNIYNIDVANYSFTGIRYTFQTYV